MSPAEETIIYEYLLGCCQIARPDLNFWVEHKLYDDVRNIRCSRKDGTMVSRYPVITRSRFSKTFWAAKSSGWFSTALAIEDHDQIIATIQSVLKCKRSI